MFTTIITDCHGENEAGRQVTRYHALKLGPCTIIGVASTFGLDSTIEAAGNLIDILDASLGEEGTIVVNVAPRGVKKDGENGNYFAYFYNKKTLIISSTKGYCLALIKKFGIVSEVNVLPTEEILKFALESKLISEDEKKHIVSTQFRSFEFVPRVAKWLHDGVNLPTEVLTLNEVPEIPQCVWCIDAFGNAKTTLTLEDIEIDGNNVNTNLGQFPFYERLKDVADGETAFYIGSSGLGAKRFLEIATQNREGSAAKSLSLKLGTEIKTGR